MVVKHRLWVRKIQLKTESNDSQASMEKVSQIQLKTDFSIYTFAHVLFPDIVQSSWQQKPDSRDKFRELNFNISLTHPMGPKHSAVTETQVSSKLIALAG